MIYSKWVVFGSTIRGEAGSNR